MSSSSSGKDGSCRVAFVGAGGMTVEHAKAFADVPGVTLVGLHSRTRAKAEQTAAARSIPLVTSSVAELYEKTRADLVVVSVPELSAREVALACFEFPWTVLLEKPAGYNLAQAEEIAAAARSRGRRAFVGLNRRFLSSTQGALADLAHRPGPRFIQVADQQSLALARQIGHPEEVVKNWMYANSIHLVDYLPALGRGKIQRVQQVVPWRDGTSPVVVASVEFDSGDIGIYSAIWNGPGPWMATVSTPERRWEFRPLEAAVYQNAGERALHQFQADPRDAAFKPGFRLQAEHVVNAVLNKPSNACTIDDALVTMRLIAEIYR
ncbi:MAG: Gfo/Idh/MocA family oxidoreductase [Planctomycetota bacterium]|nr:Gfo/Idh/MocA family oxidoreductase [Planctomycetota bacterium]